jgi:hypothetical protein
MTDAILNEKNEIASFLKEMGANMHRIPVETAVAMCTAASDGDLTKIKNLISSGADANSNDYNKRTPLYLAASEGHFDIVKYLIENGANVNAVDRFRNTPLFDCQKETSTLRRKISA